MPAALLCAALAFAGELVPSDSPSTPAFAPPVRLTAGGAFMGEDRYFPSPVFHDVNHDGLLDVVIGDLRGRITVALRRKGEDPRAYEAETELMAVDGKRIDFHNW